MERKSSPATPETLMGNALAMRKVLAQYVSFTNTLRKEKINLAGKIPNQVAEDAGELAITIQEKYARVIEKTIEAAENVSEVTRKQIKEAYVYGLSLALKGHRSLQRKNDKVEESQTDVAEGYSLNFILSLRESVRRKEESSLDTLSLASKSYILLPRIISRLRGKFPEINFNVIKTAATEHPRNPEGFIRNYLDILGGLREKYPEVDRGVLNAAALYSYKNPGGFIDRYLAGMNRLEKKYPDIDRVVIHEAARNYPRNPDKFVDAYLATLNRLEEKYPDIDIGVLHEAALYHPSKSDAFIEKYLHQKKAKNQDKPR